MFTFSSTLLGHPASSMINCDMNEVHFFSKLRETMFLNRCLTMLKLIAQKNLVLKKIDSDSKFLELVDEYFYYVETPHQKIVSVSICHNKR